MSDSACTKEKPHRWKWWGRERVLRSTGTNVNRIPLPKSFCNRPDLDSRVDFNTLVQARCCRGAKPGPGSARVGPGSCLMGIKNLYSHRPFPGTGLTPLCYRFYSNNIQRANNSLADLKKKPCCYLNIFNIFYIFINIYFFFALL